jgi:hypothetical protein
MAAMREVTPSNRRVHRILRASTILYALALLVLVHSGVFVGMVGVRLLVWLMTLWLLWPIALLLYPAGSVTRIGVPVVVSLVLLWPLVDTYRVYAPYTFLGAPVGIELSCGDLRDYFASRREGRAAAEQDIRAGVLAIEEWGLPMPQRYDQLLRERFNVEVRQTFGDVNVPATVMGHAKGYNDVSQAEIARRFGAHALEEAEDQAWKEYHANSAK